MADENTSAASSVAEATFEEVSLESLTADQDRHWRLTGELPAKQAASPPAKETIEPPADAGEVKGNQEAGKGKGVKTRTAEIDADVQELEAKLARRADLKRQLEDEKPTDKATAPVESKNLPADSTKPVRPVEPDENSFNTWDEYRAAQKAYNAKLLDYHEDMADYKAKVAVQEDRKQREFESSSRAVSERWNKGVEAVSKEVGVEEWNKAQALIAPMFDGKDPAMSLPAKYIIESEAGPQIALHFGQNPDELKALGKMDPIKQIETLAELKISLTKPARKEDVPPPGPKRTTEVPPPPRDLAGRNAPPKDAVQAALESGDTGAYIAAANAQDVAAKQSGRAR